MTNIQNNLPFDPTFHEEIASQQQTMISVFKEEVLRLQEQVLKTEKERD